MRWQARFRDKFWLVPTLFSVAALALALATTSLDEALELDGLGSEPLGYTGGADGARAFLSTVAGSMITVAATAFSITIAILALTSVQFGPRLIRNFVRDVSNQAVLGTFLATFLYCLVVLRTVRGPDEGEFVPYLSIAVASLLALASLAMLIYFISHVSRSIQVMNVVASISRDLDAAILELYPAEGQHVRRDRVDPESEALFARDFRHVASRRSGYIQSIDYGALLGLAQANGIRLRVPRHPGQFIARGATIAEAINDDGTWPESHTLGEQIVGAFTIGDDRTAEDDIEYHIDQLVEVGVRSLSPAINDPFTAMACIDRLGSSLRLLVRRELPSPYHRDADGALRVVSKNLTFDGALDAAFNLLRQYGATSAPVAMRLMETLAIIGEHTSDPDETGALLAHARMVEHTARQRLEEAADVAALEERFGAAIVALETPDQEAL